MIQQHPRGKAGSVLQGETPAFIGVRSLPSDPSPVEARSQRSRRAIRRVIGSWCPRDYSLLFSDLLQLPKALSAKYAAVDCPYFATLDDCFAPARILLLQHIYGHF